MDAIRDTPVTVVEATICFFSSWTILGLCGYHTYLICRSITTNEDVSVILIKAFYLFLFKRLKKRGVYLVMGQT